MNNQKKFFRYFQVAALITVLSLFATLTFEAVHEDYLGAGRKTEA